MLRQGRTANRSSEQAFETWSLDRLYGLMVEFTTMSEQRVLDGGLSAVGIESLLWIMDRFAPEGYIAIPTPPWCPLQRLKSH